MEAPPVIIPARQRPLWWLGAALLLAAAALVLFLFNPARYGFYPRCALYTTTGLYCPGCGSLRALHQLAHGHLLAALHYNPLLILSLPWPAYYFLRCGTRWAAGRPLPPLPLHPGWIKLYVVLVVLFSVLRNIPCAPFTWLAPPG